MTICSVWKKVVEQKFSNRSSWKWKRANIGQVKQKKIPPWLYLFTIHNDKGIILVIIAIFSSRMFGLLSQAVEQDKMKEIAVGYNHTLSFQSSFLNTASSHAISVLIIVITAEHILHCLNLSIWACKCLCCSLSCLSWTVTEEQWGRWWWLKFFPGKMSKIRGWI